MLALPSHRMQPLDDKIFRPLNTFLSSSTSVVILNGAPHKESRNMPNIAGSSGAKPKS
jgi:hypothetical protein